MSLPTELTTNAWTGIESGNQSMLNNPAVLRSWALKERVDPGRTLAMAADEPPDLRNWKDARVGWGLVLAENEAISAKERALAEDAPANIRRLWEARGRGPVFRYRKDRDTGTIRRYGLDGTARDPNIAQSEFGVGEKQIPRYLLLVGSPEKIDWDFQYELNMSRYVGRLDLSEGGQKNYVDALMDDWSTSTVSSNRPLIWCVDHGSTDMSHLMRKTIAEPVVAKLKEDNQISGKLPEGLLFDDDATATGLVERLAHRKPAFILTTSHGSTPTDDLTELSTTLGIPVDKHHKALNLEDLANGWKPDGAIWYAHACCGAGSAKHSSYDGLFPETTSLAKLLSDIAKVGSTTAPLPRKLLGCEKPLRAFISHVEPTFSWTIRDPRTNQVLTNSICNGLYNRMFRVQPETVGMAFDRYFHDAGALFSQWRDAKESVAAGNLSQVDVALHRNLAALDRRSMVILGDPTVALPPLT